MSAAKSSRNCQRKQIYAAQADAGSRNQVMIDGPIVGHFEMRDVMVPCPRCTGDDYVFDPDCRRCCGTRQVPKFDARGRVQRVQVIVHDDAKGRPENGVAVPRAPKREPKAQARRRQLAAWTRCAYATAHETSAQHDFSGKRGDATYRADRCITCGCLHDETAAA